MSIISTEDCARELLETVPLVMRDIHKQMRSRTSPDLTAPQFRTLSFIHRNEGASLTEVADHMGLKLPTMSKMVNDLFNKGYLQRKEQAVDRRRVKLVATARGVKIMTACRQGTLQYLSTQLYTVNASDREVIVHAMSLLRSVFKEAKKFSK